ncbi:MAG: M15 family metallopeptidase [Clostridia bacterium]|nr:M15 family metallopeptidase [Clostridia bacterium]
MFIRRMGRLLFWSFAANSKEEISLSNDASGFVLLSEAAPDAVLEIRYFSTYNFMGERVDGYEQPTALLTREAAAALKAVGDSLAGRGCRLKIFDAYRPKRAVAHFMRWAKDAKDTRMKAIFYPYLEKDKLIPSGYIAERSSHSRGSTLDLTLFDMATGRDVDMGGPFDFFGELSHPSYRGISRKQYENRMLLREAMLAGGFLPYEEEWWHFTLENEPYPDVYFDFPVHEASLLRG